MPDAITTPPEELVQGLRGTMPLIRELAADDDVQAAERANGAADFLRSLLPHLDDLTLAAFTCYVTVNLAAAAVGCPEPAGQIYLGTAQTFAGVTQALAWSLEAPEAPESTP